MEVRPARGNRRTRKRRQTEKNPAIHRRANFLLARLSGVLRRKAWDGEGSRLARCVRRSRGHFKKAECAIGHMAGIKADPAAGTKEKKPDPLVKWAWNPGPGRESAPGSFDDFAKLVQMWMRHKLE